MMQENYLQKPAKTDEKIVMTRRNTRMNIIAVALTHALISGVMNKEFSYERAIVMAVDYMYKGALSEGQVIQIIEAMPVETRDS